MGEKSLFRLFKEALVPWEATSIHPVIEEQIIADLDSRREVVPNPERIALARKTAIESARLELRKVGEKQAKLRQLGDTQGANDCENEKTSLNAKIYGLSQET